VVRVLVPYSRTLYFNDRGAQRGLTADTLRDFEVFLNKKYPKKAHPIVVVALPTTRDRMLSGLVEGRADIAAGNLTITPERDAKVDFTKPLAQGAGEIVVTGPRSPSSPFSRTSAGTRCMCASRAVTTRACWHSTRDCVPACTSSSCPRR